MTTFITQFPLPAAVNLDDFRSTLAEIAPQFQKPTGLHSKVFLLAEDGTSAGGVYLWRSKADARAFEPTVRAMIRQALGVEAVITYFETPVVVDNLNGALRIARPVDA